MYYNHNLRTNIQEWKSRLYRATYDQFGHQIKYCFSNFDSNKVINGLIQEATAQYPYDTNTLKSASDEMENRHLQMSFANNIQHCSFCYQILKFIIELDKTFNLHMLTFFHHRDFEDAKKDIIEGYFTPIFYYLHDKLEKSNSVIYLLEKYKRRTEWFTSKKLLAEYSDANKNYEQIFEDDLRLFLFDQGIDYPFSTPKSTSGRADIIGSIDTSDPIVLEIKIFDRKKNYGKDRIIAGFSQIIKYTNDYNKEIGYLVIFNADNSELSFQLTENSRTFPPMVTLNNKCYFIITININTDNSASKIGKTEILTINEIELTK